jgi:hypothetical protein
MDFRANFVHGLCLKASNLEWSIDVQKTRNTEARFRGLLQAQSGPLCMGSGQPDTNRRASPRQRSEPVGLARSTLTLSLLGPLFPCLSAFDLLYK